MARLRDEANWFSYKQLQAKNSESLNTEY